ncbi:cytochrome c [Oleiagrimonas sp.]|jgi:mono/diheme cytochrome c family protein|uniref:c-type cytochrome n=1 Tax=Oleiagrimonas sp. TaxID=2010330 RepID=UPI00263556F2|nr:cytochrome c [Oleiagrimonas sp.]MDA3914897.1 cytochrome c [Oleiagrimonas sp.]
MKRSHWMTVLLLGLMLPAVQSAWSADVVPANSVAKGSAVFHQTCISCHGANGKGMLPGMPDFNNPHGVLTLPETVLEQRITNGYHGGNPPPPIAMPPKGGNSSLTQTDIKNVIAYLRTTFQH